VAQEQENVSNQLFEAGVALLFLYNPYDIYNPSNKKALLFAFEFFTEAAFLEHFSGKVIAACLAKELNQSFPYLTQTDLDIVVTQSTTLEGKRNLALCYYYGFLKETVESEYYDISINENGARTEQVVEPEHLVYFEKAAFPNGRSDVGKGDRIALYYDARLEQKKRREKVYRTEYPFPLTDGIYNGILIACEMEEENFSIDVIAYLKRIRDSLVLNAPARLNEIKSLKDSPFELLLCTPNVPTEVITPLQNKLQNNNLKLIAASMSKFFATINPPSIDQLSPRSYFKFPCRII
jgi:hypothetical protein